MLVVLPRRPLRIICVARWLSSRLDAYSESAAVEKLSERPNSGGRANTVQLRDPVVLGMELPARLASPLEQWGLAPVVHWEPIATGLNNRSWHLFTSDGQYVLREHLNATDPRRTTRIYRRPRHLTTSSYQLPGMGRTSASGGTSN